MRKMNEEEEKDTLENFLNSSFLELLLNETEDEKILFIRSIGDHRLSCAILGFITFRMG